LKWIRKTKTNHGLTRIKTEKKARTNHGLTRIKTDEDKIVKISRAISLKPFSFELDVGKVDFRASAGGPVLWIKMTSN